MEGMHETTLLRLLERIWECEGVREQALDVFVPRFLVEPSKGVSSCHVRTWVLYHLWLTPSRA